MHKSEDFAQELINSGYDFFTGVPCSIIGNLITNLTERPNVTYIPAVREDAAVGVASGAYMAGKIPVVLMQHYNFNHDNIKSLMNMSYKLVTENREPLVLFLKKGIIE